MTIVIQMNSHELKAVQGRSMLPGLDTQKRLRLNESPHLLALSLLRACGSAWPHSAAMVLEPDSGSNESSTAHRAARRQSSMTNVLFFCIAIDAGQFLPCLLSDQSTTASQQMHARASCWAMVLMAFFSDEARGAMLIFGLCT